MGGIAHLGTAHLGRQPKKAMSNESVGSAIDPGTANELTGHTVMAIVSSSSIKSKFKLCRFW